MHINDYRAQAHKMVDWICNYYENIGEYPVKSAVSPGDIARQIPSAIPEDSESFDLIWKDFVNIILPGITHWQHPHFHAYFNANTSFPSLLGEMITAALGSQCMIWDTSPAAAELEERMMEWLRDSMGLPLTWSGVIQDTASTATLCALLTAREKATEYEINRKGIGLNVFRIYSSTEAHSSLEKGVKIAGFGKENLVKIAVDERSRMDPQKLSEAINLDIQNGYIPLFVMAALGTTSTLAVDPLAEIAKICEQFDIWLHVDAAYAGSALLLPEFKWMIEGIDAADSFVYNPHKWLFTNFDCTAYFIKDRAALIKTFEILPEYLKTESRGRVNDYRDWGIPLGRRFRALKLWFVLRSFGLENLKLTISNHIQWARDLANKIALDPNWELMQDTQFNMIVCRYVPEWISDPETLNKINEVLLNSINSSGEAYMTHTKLNDKYVLRVVFGQTYLEKTDVENMWAIMQRHVETI